MKPILLKPTRDARLKKLAEENELFLEAFIPHMIKSIVRANAGGDTSIQIRHLIDELRDFEHQNQQANHHMQLHYQDSEELAEALVTRLYPTFPGINIIANDRPGSGQPALSWRACP